MAQKLFQFVITLLTLFSMTSIVAHADVPGLLNRLDKIETELRILADRTIALDRLMIRSGRIGVKSNADVNPGLSQTKECADELNPKFRGVMKQRQNFKLPFPKDTEPTVFIALSTIDFDSLTHMGRHRISLSVDHIDNNGFSYSIYTWCDTRVWAAEAVWLAYIEK